MPTFGEVTKTLAVKRKTAQRSVPKGHRDNAPDTPPFGEQRGHDGGSLRVFTCACGKVQVGSFRGFGFILLPSVISSRPQPPSYPSGIPCEYLVLTLRV